MSRSRLGTIAAALLCVAAMVVIARAHDAAGPWRAIASLMGRAP